MKPLELTVHRQFQDRRGDDWYVWGDTCVQPWVADSYADQKRFTDAELAAEYHSAWALMLDVPEDERYPHERPRIERLHRFATLPHYDEVSL